MTPAIGDLDINLIDDHGALSDVISIRAPIVGQYLMYDIINIAD